MKLLRRAPVDAGADRFSRVDVNADEDMGSCWERMSGRFYRDDQRSHTEAWVDGRREDALQRFAGTVKRLVQPLGFVEAFKADAPSASREVELRWLEETQEQDIAPESSILAANGVEALSLQSFTSYVDETGEERDLATDFLGTEVDDEEERCLSEIADDFALEAADHLQNEALAQILDVRAEEFLRLVDRQRWYSTRPLVARYFVTDNGKRGIAPKARHPWTPEGLRRALASAPPVEDILQADERRNSPEWAARRAQMGTYALITHAERRAVEANKALAAWFDSLDDDAQRTALDVLDEHEAMRIKEGIGYAPNEACSQCEASIARMLLFISIGPVALSLFEYGGPDTCAMCRGSGSSTHTIGLDGVAAPEPWAQGWRDHEPADPRFIRGLMVRTFGLRPKS